MMTAISKKACAFLCLLVCALLLWPSEGWAHRVNIYAWVEGNVVHVQAGFGRKTPARQSAIAVMDGRDKTILLNGTTDDGGKFSFPLPAIAGEHGLAIRINAGEGHQNEWQLKAEECVPRQGEVKSSAQAPATQASGQSATPATETPQNAASATVTLTADELRSLVDASVDAVLERKLAPLREALAAQADAGPRLVDVIGGLGWIFGLAGLLLALRVRRGRT